MKGAKGSGKPAAGAFPGGLVAPEKDELRVAVDKRPYAEIIGHAVAEPDVEVCGVLVGRFGEDEHGPFVHVTGAIRGESAKEEGAAVTFTHDTWNHIHQEMDRRFKDEQIVGWYHTHGGFGVFLSEMDVFVHDNFFSDARHLAYVYDPLAGSEAFFFRRGGALEPARRYWLGGRERRPTMRLPEPAAAPAAPPAPVAAPTPEATAAPASPLERAAQILDPGARGGLGTLLPWGLAALLALLLVLEGRGFLQSPARAEMAGPVVIVDHNPVTGQAVGIPLEILEGQAGTLFRDRAGNLRQGIAVAPLQPGLLGALVRAPRTEAEIAEEHKRAEAQAREARETRRLLLWAAGAALAVAGALALGWYLLTRRR